MARFFIERYNAKFKQHIEGISPEAENLLLTYHWPGNVRELRNAIERAMILEDTAYIRPASLHIEVPDGGSALVSVSETGLSLLEHERNMVVHALDAAGGNQTQAARLLRITRDTLRYNSRHATLQDEEIRACFEEMMLVRT